MCESSLDVKKTYVESSNSQIQAVVLNFSEVDVLWINAYLPTDPQTINFDDTNLIRILNDIEKIIENSVYDEIIFGADFNWDRTRNSGFAACMERWVNKVGLLDVWEKYPVSFTHIHTDMRSVSTLDRFLVHYLKS